LYKPAPSGWTPVVGTCSAVDGTGIAEVWETVAHYRARTEAGGYFDAQRRTQRRDALHHYLGDLLRQHFFAHPALEEHLQRLESAVSDGKISPYEAARELVEQYTASR
jgi:LAO/AO transport system kinase